MQNLQGTVKFLADTKYWAGHAFQFDFQDQAAWWLLGGQNITLDGGGTIDGSGQAWYDALYVHACHDTPLRAERVPYR